MKIKHLILAILFLFIRCNNDEIQQEDNPFIGSWKLIETYESNSQQWISLSNGYTYVFDKDGTFTSNRFSECTKGVYFTSNNLLSLKYECSGFTTGIEIPKGTFIERYVFENNFLFLNPTYMNCDEGCDFKFKKNEK